MRVWSRSSEHGESTGLNAMGIAMRFFHASGDSGDVDTPFCAALAS